MHLVYNTGSCQVLAVADGMEGHKNGFEAAQKAIFAIKNAVYAAVKSNGDDYEKIKELIKEAIMNAHLEIDNANEKIGGSSGTTIALAIIDNNGKDATVYNVGDSPAYYFDFNLNINTITEAYRDDSLVDKLVRENSITLEQAFIHEKRNVIMQAVGMGYINIHETNIKLSEGGVFVVSSDGLHYAAGS